MAKIEVIDLFAGPGGLGEGFSAYANKRRSRPFHIAMSVEKEPSAHKTLELRALIRQFSQPPEDYYRYVRGEFDRNALFGRYPRKSEAARAETLFGPKELGPAGGDDPLIYGRLGELIKQHRGAWVVIGGPPCQAYSLVGRARNRGIKDYRPENDKRHFLYEEYLKVLSTVRPEVFVMENVKGILSSKVGGSFVFPRLVDDIRCPDESLGKKATLTSRYRIYSLVNGEEMNEITGSGATCVIRAENYGVPQARHRVILLGVREDLPVSPGILARAEQATTVGDVLRGMPKLRSGLSRTTDTAKAWLRELSSHARTVSRELRAHGFSSDVVDAGLLQSEKIKRRGGRYVRSSAKYRGASHLADWIADERIGGFLNHETRGHMSADLARYLYCSSFASLSEGMSPRSFNFPEVLAPNHQSWKSGKFADRFKVQTNLRPSGTVTSHISKDGHYYIHYDPAQCRSLTVREAARLQTFPDNYFFEGNRTQQYVQVGNAVPPYLANQVAALVYDLIG